MSQKTIYKPSYDKIVKKLRQARKEATMTQDQVNEALGKYQSFTSKIENKDRKIDVLELIELAQLYNKDIEYFVNDEESE